MGCPALYVAQMFCPVLCRKHPCKTKPWQVLAFFAHAYLVVFHSFDEDNLNGRVRAAVPWFIISIFVVEGEMQNCSSRWTTLIRCKKRGQRPFRPGATRAMRNRHVMLYDFYYLEIYVHIAYNSHFGGL